LSNAWLVRGGVSILPTEKTKLLLCACHFESLDDFAAPWPQISVFGVRMAPFAPLTFLSKKNDGDLGTEIELIGSYKYNEDLSFEAGYAHLFTGPGLAQGNYNVWNGLMADGGANGRGDAADYLYVETKLVF
jgi:hypothetical protein